MLNLKTEIKLIILSIFVFVTCAISVSVDSISSIDREFSLRTYNFLHNDFITGVFLIITDYTITTVAGVCLVVGLLIYRKLFLRILIFALASGLVWLTVEIAKNTFFRLRPFIRELNIAYFSSNVPDGFGFPSHHAALAFFIAFFANHTLKLKRWQQILVYFLAATVAFSRVYLGAHYWLDVIGGAAIGIYFGAVEISIYYRLFKGKS